AELSRLPWNSLIVESEQCRYLVSEIASPRAFMALKDSKEQFAGISNQEKVLLAGGIKFRDDSFYLPGTAKEVANIKTLAGAHGFQVVSLTEKQATKDALLMRLSQSNYAHLATHGFFDERKEARSETPTAIANLPT